MMLKENQENKKEQKSQNWNRPKERYANIQEIHETDHMTDQPTGKKHYLYTSNYPDGKIQQWTQNINPPPENENKYGVPEHTDQEEFDW